MTPNAKAKFEEFQDRLGAALREVISIHAEVDLLLEAKEINKEELENFRTKVETVYETEVLEVESNKEQKKKLKEAINPF